MLTGIPSSGASLPSNHKVASHPHCKLLLLHQWTHFAGPAGHNTHIWVRSLMTILQKAAYSQVNESCPAGRKLPVQFWLDFSMSCVRGICHLQQDFTCGQPMAVQLGNWVALGALGNSLTNKSNELVHSCHWDFPLITYGLGVYP